MGKANPLPHYTDLFEMLLIEENKNMRNNPILSALLYAYCPAAAHYWLAGAEPVVPFNPAWEAMWDFGSDERMSIGEALRKRDLDNALGIAGRYVKNVGSLRDVSGGLISPELSDNFDGDQFEKNERFGSDAGIQKNMGKSWDNFFAYVRTWYFLLDDWALNARIPVTEETTVAEFDRIELGIALPGIKTIYFPALMWTQKTEGGQRHVIGLLTANNRHDQLRFALVARAGGYRFVSHEERGKPYSKGPTEDWKSLPEVWAFDYPSGATEPFDNRLYDDAKLKDIVLSLHAMAEKGHRYPARAMNDPRGCATCGFLAQCFAKDGQFSPIAIAGVLAS